MLWRLGFPRVEGEHQNPSLWESDEQVRSPGISFPCISYCKEQPDQSMALGCGLHSLRSQHLGVLWTGGKGRKEEEIMSSLLQWSPLTIGKPLCFAFWLSTSTSSGTQQSYRQLEKKPPSIASHPTSPAPLCSLHLQQSILLLSRQRTIYSASICWEENLRFSNINSWSWFKNNFLCWLGFGLWKIWTHRQSQTGGLAACGGAVTLQATKDMLTLGLC